MIALLLATMGALAADPGPAGLRNTADTLPRGAWVIRLPTGRSATGLGPSTELWLTPFDVILGGTRVGVEQRVWQGGDLAWSLAPNVGQKWSLGRTSLRVESVLSWSTGPHRVNLLVAPDLALMRRSTLSDDRTTRWSVAAVHLPAALSYDHSWERTVLRASARVALLDEGQPLSFGLFTGSWIHRFGHLHVELGAGLLVGRPSEDVFLGTYQHLLVAPYPKLDLWWQI